MHIVPEGLDVETILRIAERAEGAGLDAMYVSDHRRAVLSDGAAALECFMVMSVLARHTASLEIGSLVCPLQRRSVSLLAQSCETLAVLAPGRFRLGLGLGWHAADLTDGALPTSAAKDHIEQLVAELGNLMIPIFLGGNSPRVLNLCSELGLGWSGFGPSERFKARHTLVADVAPYRATTARTSVLLTHLSELKDFGFYTELGIDEVIVTVRHPRQVGLVAIARAARGGPAA